MDKELVESLRMSKRKEYMKLGELNDLTAQLAQSAERRDEVSTKMLLSMRQQPLLELQEIEDTIRQSLLAQPEEDAIRLSALLTGKGEVEPPILQEEEALRDLCEQNRRILDRVIQIDRRISMGMGGKRSYYNNIR